MSDGDSRDAAPFAHAENVGAWVLGALDDETAREFAAELQRSPQLRAEVARLQPIVDTLPMGVEQLSPPPALRDRIMATVQEEAQLQRAAAGAPRVAAPGPASARRERRGRFLGLRPLTVAGLACLALVVGIGAGLALSGGGDPTGSRTVVAKVAFPGATGRLVDRGEDGGRLELTGIPNAPTGRVYQVWLVPKGKAAPVPTDALFTPNGAGNSTVDVPGDLRDVEQVLVTDEPVGGSRTPTRTPIISATV